MSSWKTARGWQSHEHDGQLGIMSQVTASNNRLIFSNKQKIYVSANVCLSSKDDWVALRVHAISAQPLGSGKATIARVACRASPFSFDPSDPAHYGPLIHTPFTGASAADPIVIAAEGLSSTASFGSGQQGPSFQAAARAGALGIHESSQDGLLAASCQRRCHTEKVQWVLRFSVDVRWCGRSTTPHIMDLEPFRFNES